ncbi:MAG: MarC family protein [Deltaproteobacteria bacterium]|nr:MarC family protein [Deltaproteobacteria bacterium]
MPIENYIHAVLALFAIVNPVGNLPVFSEMTEDLDPPGRQSVYRVAVLTGLVTLLTMTLTGKWIMSSVFQINILEFRIAGGLLLTVIAIKYIVFAAAKGAVHSAQTVQEIMNLGAVPMAVPLLVGPGSIVTGILILDRDGYLITISAILTVFLVTWALLYLSPWINRMLGKIGSIVVSRVLWIFLAAIGVHFLLTGIAEYFQIR